MIEVEKKFKLSAEEEAKLIEDAEFLKEVTNTDTYYDNEKYDLTSRGLWLRQRNDRFELKVNVSKKLNELGRPDWNTTEFKELETDNEIRQELNLENSGNMAEDIKTAGYEPFVTLTTTRRKYRDQDHAIDIDTVSDGQDYNYQITEIELLVEDQNQVDTGSEKIVKYARSRDINTQPARGKLMEWIRRHNPDQFKAITSQPNSGA